VGELWLRKLTKNVIQGDFRDSEGPKAVVRISAIVDACFSVIVDGVSD